MRFRVTRPANKKAGQCPAFKSPCLIAALFCGAPAMIGLFYFPTAVLRPSNTLALTEAWR
jgi:hypothetical protein